MQVFTSDPKPVQHQVGDVVEWKGIRLLVAQVFADGSVKAVSRTTIVHVGSHEQLQAVEK